MRLAKLKDDCRYKNGVSRLKIPSGILSHGVQVYTNKMFKFFQAGVNRMHERILCCHALKVFDFNNLTSIPSEYILKRWTKDAQRGISGTCDRLASSANVSIVSSSVVGQSDIVRLDSESKVDLGFVVNLQPEQSLYFCELQQLLMILMTHLVVWTELKVLNRDCSMASHRVQACHNMMMFCDKAEAENLE
ncbi:hypothetical protein Dsin_024460 [Dipteronia sinensis]|uniref:Protein FAR1-RELATED SEQUENCE n=1 Tax=Dipteronia sinensis TaxID=43782 RepID=A0AAD9ZU19_9ROSI|nr:hypothetical protein Dsin_024460 [Dipteronia sinensis]